MDMRACRYMLILDIDGTVVEGSAREGVMEEQGLVVGPYGDPNRTYPYGKAAFLEAFNHPSMFHMDTTLPDAHTVVRLALAAGADIFYLTARDVLHHEAIRHDLDRRGLWNERMRLNCKPHVMWANTVDYKLWTLEHLCGLARPGDAIYIENHASIGKAAEERVDQLTSYVTCSDAVHHLQRWAKRCDTEGSR